MKTPGPLTRLLGARVVALSLYIFLPLVVFGWLTGHTPLLSGIVALFGILHVRAATLTMREYHGWWREWNAMGGGEMPAPKKAKTRPSKRRLAAQMAVCVLLLNVIADGLPDGQRAPLPECVFGVVLIANLVWSLYQMFTLDRRNGDSEIGSKKGLHPSTPDVVQLALPPASSSPSRLEVTRRLTGYAARLLTSGRSV